MGDNCWVKKYPSKIARLPHNGRKQVHSGYILSRAQRTKTLTSLGSVVARILVSDEFQLLQSRQPSGYGALTEEELFPEPFDCLAEGVEDIDFVIASAFSADHAKT